mmetsp:Transcript_30210/g.73530  ORF Transcript_30210/g.73530 Transcript_30210/m.73530 type:complete len:515 (-) Transcript_30210:414-1958(-)
MPHMDSGVGENPGATQDATPESARALIYRTVAFCSMTSMLLGYDVGIMAGALPNMKEDLDLSTTEEETIAGSLNIVAGICAVLAGYTADRLGRKKALAIACVIFGTGAGIMTSAMDFWVLFLGRIITGVGVGFGLVIAPLYLSEVVPPEKRGFLVCLFDVILNVGILEGYIVGYVIQVSLGDPGTRWRIMIAIGILPPILILLGLPFLQESPRWLMQIGREDEARQVLGRMVPNPDAVQNMAHEIKEVIKAETSNSYKDVLCPATRALKAALHISLGLSIAQQITGSEAVIYYTPEIMKQAGITDQAQQMLWALPVGAAKLAGELISVPMLDTQGRRPMLLIGGAMQAVSLLLLALSFWLKWGFAATLIFVCSFMFFFEVAAPISWLMPSEVYSTGKRGKAQSASVTVNRLVSGSIAISFLSISNAITVPGTFMLFSGLAVLVTIWYFLVVPETKGLALEEVTMILGRHEKRINSSAAEDEFQDSGYDDIVSSGKYVHHHRDEKKGENDHEIGD